MEIGLYNLLDIGTGNVQFLEYQIDFGCIQAHVLSLSEIYFLIVPAR